MIKRAPKLKSGSGDKPRTSATRKAAPYPFVLEALDPLQPLVRPMFSGYAVYAGDKLILMLRDRPTHLEDNGIWIVCANETETVKGRRTLRSEFPSMRTIKLLGGMIKHWMLLPSDSPNFETEAMHACDLALAHDPRLGRIPESRKAKKPKHQPSKPPPNPLNS